jgi:hypothetical protein
LDLAMTPVALWSSMRTQRKIEQILRAWSGRRVIR